MQWMTQFQFWTAPCHEVTARAAATGIAIEASLWWDQGGPASLWLDGGENGAGSQKLCGAWHQPPSIRGADNTQIIKNFS